MANTLQAGFARVEISPRKASVPLGGHGASQFRLCAQVVDPLYANVIALANGEERCIYLSLDLIYVPPVPMEAYRAAISEATGVPANRIFACGSHTHAGPDMHSMLPTAVAYREVELPAYLVEAAKRALADLKPAKLSYGKGLAGRPGAWMNFDRHYYGVETAKKDSYTEADLLDGVGAVKSGFTRGDYVPVRHKEEADHSLQVLRFSREAADDIILVNYAAHGTTADLNQRCPNVSSDHPGALVKRLEEILPGTKCAYLQGCCGNLIPNTLIEEEGVRCITYDKDKHVRDWHAYGAVMASYAYEILMHHMQESETDTLQFVQHDYVAKYDHQKDDLVEQAKEALKVFDAEGHTPEAKAWCKKFNLGGVYACGAIIRRASLPETGSFELNAIRIGDCAIATIPFEPFSSIGESIKAASPFAMTFVNGYCGGHQGYLPNKNVNPKAYEGLTTNYVLGTGEGVAEKLVEMLKKLK